MDDATGTTSLIGLLTYDEAESQIPLRPRDDAGFCLRRLVARGDITTVDFGGQLRITVAALQDFLSGYIDTGEGTLLIDPKSPAQLREFVRQQLHLPRETLAPRTPYESNRFTPDNALNWACEKWQNNLRVLANSQLPDGLILSTELQNWAPEQLKKKLLVTPGSDGFSISPMFTPPGGKTCRIDLPRNGGSVSVPLARNDDIDALLAQLVPPPFVIDQPDDRGDYHGVSELFLVYTLQRLAMKLVDDSSMIAISGPVGLYRSKAFYDQITTQALNLLESRVFVSASVLLATPLGMRNGLVNVSVDLSTAAIMEAAHTNRGRLAWMAF